MDRLTITLIVALSILWLVFADFVNAATPDWCLPPQDFNYFLQQLSPEIVVPAGETVLIKATDATIVWRWDAARQCFKLMGSDDT